MIRKAVLSFDVSICADWVHLAGRDRRVGRGDLRRLCRRKLCDGRGTFLHHGRFAFAHLVLALAICALASASCASASASCCSESLTCCLA